MDKIKNIEFLRIIGCIAIIFLHMFHNKYLHEITFGSYFYNKAFDIFADAVKAVDLFFILSGVFFMLTLNTTSTILKFLLKKVIRFYPVMLFSLFISFIMFLFGLNDFYLCDNILSFFGLSGTGLAIYAGNLGLFWYVSSLLWTMLLLFYLIKNYEKRHINLLAAFAIFFCYSFIIHAKDGKIDHHTQTFCYVFNIGMMRAFGGIGIGYFIGDWYKNNIEKIKLYVPSFMMKIVFTGIEFLCLFFIINSFFFKSRNISNDIIFILCFSIITIMFLANKGYIAQFFNKQIYVNMAKYTYSIYMTHILIISTLFPLLCKSNIYFVLNHPILIITFMFILILCLGCFTYHFIELPAKSYLSKKF